MSSPSQPGNIPGTGNGIYPDGLTYKFNASMAIIVVVLVTTFFFMALFVLYIRRCNMITASGWNGQSNPQPQQQQQQNPVHHGLDAESLEKLPIIRYASIKITKRGKAGPDCAVCLLPFEESDTVRLLPDCGHLFHSECIDMWLHTHSTCPLCRRNLDPKSIPANLQRALSAVMSSFRRDGSIRETTPPPGGDPENPEDAADAASRHPGAAQVVRTLSMHSESFNKALHDMELQEVREQLRARSMRLRYQHSKSFGNVPDLEQEQEQEQGDEVKIDIDDHNVGLRRSVSDGQFLKPHEFPGEPSGTREVRQAPMFSRSLRRSLKWLVGKSEEAVSAPAAPPPAGASRELDRVKSSKSQSQ